MPYFPGVEKVNCVKRSLPEQLASIKDNVTQGLVANLLGRPYLDTNLDWLSILYEGEGVCGVSAWNQLSAHDQKGRRKRTEG